MTGCKWSLRWRIVGLSVVLAVIAGCEPEVKKPQPAAYVPPPAPPPPPPLPPPPAIVFLDEPTALVSLRRGMTLPAPAAAASPWQCYLQLAEVFVPVVDADGTRHPSLLDEHPVKALRAWSTVPSLDDEHFAQAEDQAVRAITARMWEEILQRGFPRTVQSAQQLHDQLVQSLQPWMLTPAEQSVVIMWLSAVVYQDYRRTLPSGAAVDAVDFNYAQATLEAQQQARAQFVEAAWGHLCAGLSEQSPLDESGAIDLRLSLVGTTTTDAAEVALQLVNRGLAASGAVVAEYRAPFAAAPNTPQRMILRELASGAPLTVEKTTLAALAAPPQVELQAWTERARYELREPWHVGRYAELPPHHDANPVMLASLVIDKGAGDYKLALRQSDSTGRSPVKYAVRPAPNRPGAWQVLMKSSNTPPTGETIALVELENNRVRFRWNPKSHADARLLANCALDISSGSITQRVNLTRPQLTPTVTLDMTKSTATVPLQLGSVPDTKQLKLQLLRLQDSPALVAAEGPFGAWVNVEFPEVPNAALRFRITEPKNQPLVVEFQPVLTFRGEEGELTADALAKMQVRNAKIAQDLPPKILASKQFIALLQLRLAAAGSNKQAAIPIEVALRDEAKKHDGFVQVFEKSTQRLAWALRAGEMIKLLHNQKLHYMITTTGDSPQLIASSDADVLNGSPQLSASVGN